MCKHIPLATINGRACELAAHMSRDHKLAFEPWETALLQEIALRHPGNVVALSDDEDQLVGTIVGGIVGGLCGRRGTISHAWVHPQLRGRRIGDNLALGAAEDLFRAGAEVIHLMVTEGNDEAVAFWERLGFSKVTDRLTFEGDIDPSRFPEISFQEAQPHEITELAAGDENETAFLEAFLGHHATIFVARDEDGVSGFVAVGSLGVRGLIERCWAKTPELGRDLVHQAFRWLHSIGVARVHAFVPAEDPSIELLTLCGMKHDPSETTLEFFPVRCAVQMSA